MAHSHGTLFSTGNKLKYCLFLSALILVAEVVGGLLSHSLALLSDAGHVAADIVALALSWYGVRQAEKLSNSGMTFGYHRVGVIVAIVNALTIFLIAAVILFEAYRRFQSPPEVNSGLMLVVAAVGLAANLFVTFWLRQGQKGNINVRSVFWHAAGDALASLGVIVSAIIIWLTGLNSVDPIASVLISFIILFAAWSILKEGLTVILEATPKDVNVLAMITDLKKIPGVKDVHDVHVWSITPELRAMNGHILIDDQSLNDATLIRTEIEKIVRDQYHVDHTTLQLESQICDSKDTFCTLNNIVPPTAPEKHRH